MKVLWRNDGAGVSATKPEFTQGWCAGGRSGPPSEVLLPPLLSLDGVQDRLPLGLVLLPDLFNLLLHHGVEGQEPLLKVLHCPTLKLEEVESMVMTKPRSAQNSREAQPARAPRREGSSQSVGWQWLESDNSFTNGMPQALCR